MAQSGAFDRITIDDQERDATWRIVERRSSVDLHLIDGDTWQNWVHWITFNHNRRSRRAITVEIKSRKMHLMRPFMIQRQAFRSVL